MPEDQEKSKPKKKAWKSESYDGAFLFLLLHKRLAGHPDDYSAAELQDHPEWGFDQYSTQNFKRNSQTIANKVKKFEEKGTGLTKRFKEFIAEVKKDKTDLFAGVEVGSEEEEQDDDDEGDEDCEDDGEEDVSLSEDNEEASLSDPLQDPKLQKNMKETRRSQSTKADKAKQSTKATKNLPREESPFDYLSASPDGRLVGITQLSSGWEGSLVLSDDKMKVIKKTKVPAALTNAQKVLQRHGFDDNNVHVINLQAAMNAKKKAYQAKNRAPDGTKPSQWLYEEVLWHLPFEVKPQFCDANGIETNDILVESDEHGVEWAYVFMVGAHAREVEPAAPRIVRNRQRQREAAAAPQPPQPPAPPLRPGRQGGGIPGGGSFDAAFVDAMDDDL